MLGDLRWSVFSVRFGGPLVDILPELVALLAASGSSCSLSGAEGSQQTPSEEGNRGTQTAWWSLSTMGQDPKVPVADSSSLPLSNATSASIPPICRELG